MGCWSSCFKIAHPSGGLGFTHSARRRSCQSHYSNNHLLLYISSLNIQYPLARSSLLTCETGTTSQAPPTPHRAPPTLRPTPPHPATAAPIARRARPQTVGKLRLKRRIARAAAAELQHVPNRVNHSPTLPRVDRACPTRAAPPPSVAKRFGRKRVSARARKGGRGRRHANRDSKRGGVVRGDHD